MKLLHVNVASAEQLNRGKRLVTTSVYTERAGRSCRRLVATLWTNPSTAASLEDGENLPDWKIMWDRPRSGFNDAGKSMFKPHQVKFPASHHSLLPNTRWHQIVIPFMGM